MSHRPSTGEASPLERRAYSPVETAQVLGVSRSKVYEMLTAGTLTSIKLGGRQLIRSTDIDNLLQGGV